MNKKFTIDQLEKRSPFKVPDGYFEQLTSRVMASIPQEETEAMSAAGRQTGGKVIGLLPRKQKRGWTTWAVLAAACLCGALFYISTRQDNSPTVTSQVAQVKTSAEEIPAETPASITGTGNTATKVYANGSYSLSRGKRTSHESSPASSTYLAKVNTPDMASAQTLAVSQPATTKTTDAAPKTQAVASQPVEASVTSIDIAASDVDKYANEFDVIDYAQLGGSDIYDYLAGVEYY